MATEFVALYDAHFGRHKARRKGKLVTEKSHNLPVIKTAIQFVREYQPKLIILGGDQVDAESVSHWRATQPLMVEGFRLVDELDSLDENLLAPLEAAAPEARRVWLNGNHERFVDDFVDSHPGVEGMVNIANYLGLAQRGWEFVDHGEIFTVGKLNFIHGEKIGGGVHHSKRAVDLYKRNIRYGHHHTYQTYTSVSATDVQDRHTAIAVPCLANKNPGYGANRPNAWVNGWLYGAVMPNGNFWDQVAVSTGNKYYHNGRLFDGRAE